MPRKSTGRPVGRPSGSGAGKHCVVLGSREWCRRVVDAPERRKKAEEWASSDPEFYRWMWEQGYGRATGGALDAVLPPTVNLVIVNALNKMTQEQLEAYVKRGELPAST